MIIRSPSLFRLDHLTMAFLLVALALVLPAAIHGAPVYESDQTEMETYGESTGCYYNYNHYGEGDRIMTNEPCLNCTCHDRMLMCYLRVCPFTKAIGQDCTIEKREDQCCPVITCPAVEVQLLDHQTTASPSTALGGAATSEVGALDQYGCSISGRFYPDGAQVPSNPQKPCELCYCIRNMTTCVMQECTLHIDGCQPIYNKGVCCPVRYDCDHDKDTTPMLDDELTTTVRPTPGFILTTTVSPSVSTDCVHNGETYADGALIMTDKPCEHCYCMRGDIVCAVQECGTPLENEGKNCVALPPAAGQCCPDKYMCDGGPAAPTTTASALPTTTTATVADDTQDEQQKVSDDHVPFDDQEAAPEATTLQADIGKATTTSKPLADTDSQEKEDDDSEQQQQQQHVVPQFEDAHQEDDSEEEDQREVAAQVPKKTDEEQPATTARPADDEVEHDHIPGHVGPHEHGQEAPEVGTTVAPAVEAPAVTVRPDTTDKPEAADDSPVVTTTAGAAASTVRAETTDKPETADEGTTVVPAVGPSSTTVQSGTESADEGTTVPPAVGTSAPKVQADTTDKPETAEQDEVPSEQHADDHDADREQDSELDQKIDDGEEERTTPTNLHFDEPSAQAESTTLGAVPEEPRVTTTRPASMPIDDEKENEIGATHDDGDDDDEEDREYDQKEPSQGGQEQQTVQPAKDDDEPVATTPAAGDVKGTTAPTNGDESASTPAAEKELEQTTLAQREQQPTRFDATTEKKEPAHKADDVPQTPQDFVELPPAVIVTELPPAPILSEEKLSTTAQTLAPPKDEILPNLPLEADSHVLDEATTTEYTLASGDHKKQDDDAQPQHPVRTSDDFDEPVEMNTVITPEKDEQKPQQAVDADHSDEQQQEVEREPVGQDAHDSDEDDSEEDAHPGDEHGDGAAPTTAAPAHSAVHPAEQEKDDENETDVDETPDKLFPESIPGEGDCLIDGVTYDNGASVPANGKCQVACRCSNSIVHCEAVRCEPAPNAECTAKTILPGECCPRYACPEVSSSTTTEPAAVSSVDDATKDATSASADLSDLFATGSEASVSSGSTEASDISTEAASTASTADSQASSGEDQEEDDESGQPSEAESDSAGWDLDNDVFKPLRPQEPVEDVMSNLAGGFKGNRISTAKYDDEIVLTTAAPITPKPTMKPSTASVPVETTERAQSQDSPTTLSSVGQQNEEDSTPTPHVPAQRKPEIAFEKDAEDERKPDGDVPPTTAVAFDEVEGTTVAAESADQGAVKASAKPEPTTDAAVENDQEQTERATTPGAFVAQDAEQESTTFVTAQDKEQEPEVRATTLKPSADFEEEQEQQKQDVPTTVRSVEQAVDAVTDQEDGSDELKDQKGQQAADEIQSSTVRVAEQTETDGEEQSFDDAKQESTTSRLSDAELPIESATEQDEPVTVHVHKTKQGAQTTAAPSMLDELENEVEPASTPVAALAMDEEATQKVQTPEELVTTSGIAGTTASSIAADTTSSKVELDDMDASTTQQPEQAAPALGEKVLEDAEDDVQGANEPAVPTTVAPTPAAATTTAPTSAAPTSSAPTTAAPVKSDDSTQEEQKSTQELPASTTAEPTRPTDAPIVFRVDEDEETKPIVKPTLDDQKPTGVADEKHEEQMPTKQAVEKTDAEKPTKATVQDEKDDDNLINPVVGAEQDGGFHYPQESNEADEKKPIFKPTLDEVAHSTTAPESDDQVKEHDEIESTAGPSATTKSDEEEVRTTAQPEPAVTKGQQPEQHADESNEIDADLQDKPATEPAKPATPVSGADEPENPLVYDEIDEPEQQTNVPSLTTPKAVPSETQRPELDVPVTSVPTTSAPVDDETERTVPTVQRQQEVTPAAADGGDDDDGDDGEDENVTGVSKPETSSPASAVHSAATTTEQADVTEQDEEQQRPVQSLDDGVAKTTVQPAESSSDEKATTAAPLYPERDDEPSVDEPKEPTRGAAQDEQDEEDSAQDSQQPELPLFDDLDERLGEDSTTLRSAESEADSEQVTTEAAVNKQTVAAVTDRPTTIAPAQEEKHDDEQKPTTDAEDEDGSGSDEQQEQHAAPAEKDEEQDATTKVPVAHADASDSEETTSDDEKNLESAPSVMPTTTTTIDSTEASVKPAYEAPEQDSASSDEDDAEPSRATTAAVPERDREDAKPHQPPSTESNDDKEEATTTAPAKADDVEQEPALTTASDDQSKQPTTAAAPPVEADEAPAQESDEEEQDKPDADENDQRTTVKPSAEVDTTEASDDKPQEQDAEEASEPGAQDATGDDEPAPATTVRTPVRVADDEPGTDDEEPQEPVESEVTTAAAAAHDDATEPTSEEDEKAQVPEGGQAEPKPTSTAGPVAADESEDDDVATTSEQPKPAVPLGPVTAEPTQDKEDAPVPTTTGASVAEPERDQPSEEQPEEQEPAGKPTVAEDKQPEASTAAAPVAHDETSQSEEEDEPETPQTDDLNADDDSSEEDYEPAAPSPVPTTTTTTTAQPTPKAPATAPPAMDEEQEVPAEPSTTVAPLEPVTATTHAPDSDSQVTEQPTTVRREEAPVTEQAPPSTSGAPTAAAPAADEVQQTEAPHSELTDATTADREQEPAVTGSSVVPSTSGPTPTTTAETTAAAAATEQTTLAAEQKPSPSTAAPALVPDALDERLDDDAPPQVPQKPVSPVPAADDKVAERPQEASPDAGDEQQAIVKPADTDSDDADDDDGSEQQKVQEPAVPGDGKPSEPEPAQPETVGPSYGAPGQHYDSGYGHLPPHYPPSSYEEDYGEEEDPAAFGPGTCRYGGKLYVSAQQIPRDDPCDFCFCFRSDIICLQQSCPPPISGCNEEPISGFCCPRYECPVSMATVLNVTTSTTTTTTTLPPHFPSHAYKGQVQKRGCQIQGKPYNVGEMVASASGPCMRCTCGGDGQMQCEPKACSPEPMLQQMIAVAAARRR